MKKMKCEFRCDSMPLSPKLEFVSREAAARHMLDRNRGTKPVTAEDAARVMLDAPAGSAAEAARQRMLERMGLAKGDGGGAAEARRRMLQRQGR